MAEIRHLSNAPIREAIIDIQFEPLADIEAVDHFAASFASASDKVSDLWTSTLELKMEPNGVRQSQVGSRIGKRVDLEDGKHVVQFRTAGFTFSRLYPYESWEVMSDKALNFWHRYFEAMKPTVISRVATRYINSIQLPLPIDDFSGYFVYAPEVPSSLPQSISSFFSRVVIADPATSDVTNVTQMLEGLSPDQSSLTVLLDIDATYPQPLPTSDASQITTILNRLRDTKNKAFFGFLEEKALEPYL